MKWKQSTLDTNKQAVSSQIAAMNAATAQVVTLTAGSYAPSQPPSRPFVRSSATVINGILCIQVQRKR